jgi:hypothetical protein
MQTVPLIHPGSGGRERVTRPTSPLRLDTPLTSDNQRNSGLSSGLVHGCPGLHTSPAEDGSTAGRNGPDHSRTPRRTCGKRVGGNPSRVRISYPPPVLSPGTKVALRASSLGFLLRPGTFIGLTLGHLGHIRGEELIQDPQVPHRPRWRRSLPPGARLSAVQPAKACDLGAGKPSAPGAAPTPVSGGEIGVTADYFLGGMGSRRNAAQRGGEKRVVADDAEWLSNRRRKGGFAYSAPANTKT